MARKLKRKVQPKPEKPSGLSYSVHALSKLTGADRKTIDKVVSRAQIKPVKVVNSRPQYRLEDVQAALAAKPDKSLRDEKLLEEIRKLRNYNAREERSVIDRREIRTGIVSVMSIMFGELERMAQELPPALKGLEEIPIHQRIKADIESLRVRLREKYEAIAAG